MGQEERLLENGSATEAPPSAEAVLVEQVRHGDIDAVRRFFGDHYPSIYRYLLWLTERPEMAEDLTQETFIRAWRALDRFDARLSLRPWLHRIAHREFLRALRSQRRVPTEQVMVSLDDVVEAEAPRGASWTEAVELREVIRKLPREEREIVVLYYLQGYNSAEIAQIVRAPAGTVRYRLSLARERLQRELGEGDLVYLNQAPAAVLRRWAWLPLEALTTLEAHLTMVDGGWLREGEKTMSDRTNGGMSRRKLLEAAGTAAAAAAAAGLAGPVAAMAANEAEIIDERLTRKVNLAVKGIALADLCEQLHRDTGIQIVAGPSVADEKVTLFCEKLPLREVMRQLSRPFGYTWLRSRKEGGDYRYELVQDLRSQLLEEELRNRDRNAALLALDQEMNRFRPYLGLSPDEALARARTAPPEEKKLLENLAKYGWGPIQMYFRLSPQEQAALRAGQKLTFSAHPLPGQRPLPSDVDRGVLQSFREQRVVRLNDGFSLVPADLGVAEGVPLTAAPEIRPLVTLWMQQSELGQFTIDGHSGVFSPLDRSKMFYMTFRGGPYAVGQSPAVLKPDNSRVNARLAHDPALRAPVSIAPAVRGEWSVATKAPGDLSPTTHQPPLTTRKVTTADVLEALYRTTRLPLVADYYTHLYQPGAVSVHALPLFEALNQLSDTMQLRWQKEAGGGGGTASRFGAGPRGEAGAWLQFRSTTFYDDRTKEVPNRLLARWMASRREHGALTLDDLVEIAQLPDAQLDGEAMAEGARDYFGLAEWDLARNRNMRPHVRFLAEFTPEQRQEAASATGLAFTKMSLAQQQQFMAYALPADDAPIQALVRAAGFDSLQLLEELKHAALRVEYTQPGWFQWGDPASSGQWFRWVVPVKPGPRGWRVVRPSVRERTREAALQALRRLDPQLREAAVHQLHLSGRADEAGRAIPLEEQIFPSELSLTIIYIPGASNALPMRILYDGSPSWQPSS